jgi:hypothetical protein
MLRKFGFWLPVLMLMWLLILKAPDWYFDKRTQKQQWNPSFGCVLLFANEDARVAFGTTGFGFAYDCWERPRWIAFKILNFVPSFIGFGLAVAALPKIGMHNEVISFYISLSVFMCLFWWIIGNFLDKRLP